MTFYIYKNSIFEDTETLDDVLYAYYSQDFKSVNAIELLVESAYADGTVDKVELTLMELLVYFKNGYKWEEAYE